MSDDREVQEVKLGLFDVLIQKPTLGIVEEKEDGVPS
jgi:hypothetical protein